jgi:hypothetical protein
VMMIIAVIIIIIIIIIIIRVSQNQSLSDIMIEGQPSNLSRCQASI